MTEDLRPEETTGSETFTASAERVTWAATAPYWEDYPPGDIADWESEPLSAGYQDWAWNQYLEQTPYWTETATAAVVLWRILPLAPTPLRLDPHTSRAARPPRSRPPSLLYARSHRSHAPPTARPRAEEVVAAR